MCSLHHYEEGCREPEIENDGILRLYSMRFCPYATRVHIVLDAKGIPYHTINVNLTHKPGWLFRVNPIGKIPALLLVNEPGTPIITESMLIAEYLDDVYPEIKLYDTDPLKRILDKIWIERFSTVTAAFTRICKNFEEAPEAWEEAMRALDLFEMELKKRGDVYFGGTKRPNILDYSIWPWFQFFETAEVVFGKVLRFETSRFPRLTKWYANLLENDQAVKKNHIPKEIQIRYQRSKMSGKPDYNLMAALQNYPNGIRVSSNK